MSDARENDLKLAKNMNSENENDSVIAVLVTWKPDIARLKRVIGNLLPQVSTLIIVDNGSPNIDSARSFLCGIDGIDFIGLSENMGLGAALNIGLRRAQSLLPSWILTLDQDTVICNSAIEQLLRSWIALPVTLRNNCGLLAMKVSAPTRTNWFSKYSDRILTIRDMGTFIEKRAVITSGNLLRGNLGAEISFNSSFFIDQIDFDFCAKLRRHGYNIFEHKHVCMDHKLGEQVNTARGVHSYENAERLYYITRNSTYLVIRRQLSARYYIAQLVAWSGAYVLTNGFGWAVHCSAVLLLGIFDGTLSRLGQRKYRILHKGKRSSTVQ